MAVTFLPSRTLRAAAKRLHGFALATSVAHVASGYARSLRPCDACFSPAERTICSGGDR